MGFFDKLKNGLSKTRENFSQKVNEVFKVFRTVDEELFEELEEALITADVGVNTSMEIIERWRGRDHLLSHFDDRADYASASKQMVHAVKCLGLSTPACKGGRKATAAESRKNKRGITNQSRYGYFCLYSLRKAWATIAFNHCHIPMEIISMALGHSDGKGMSVTQRYVQFENRLVDEANRKVIDFVLYGNKKGEAL